MTEAIVTLLLLALVNIGFTIFDVILIGRIHIEKYKKEKKNEITLH